MKTNKVTPMIAVLGLLLGAATQAQATAETNKVSFVLTLYRQADPTVKTNSNGSLTWLSKVDTVRGGDKDLLNLLSDATGVVFPPASYIEMDGDIFFSTLKFLVKSKTNSVLADVSSYFTIHAGSDDIYSGLYNDGTQAETSLDHYILRITFYDAQGNDFDVSGLAAETYSATPMNTSGQQTLTDTVTVPISGTGHLNGDSVVVQGTITFKGKSLWN